MSGILELARAYHFAAVAHEQQRRKGGRDTPYINHLTEVAELVAEATGGEDLPLVMAAVLHDTVEDTDVAPEDLLDGFGADVAALVAEATDDKSLPKAERKRLQVEHAPHKSDRAKLLKLADKISNLRSIALTPPDWSPERQAQYVDWAEAVAAGLRGQNDWLDRQFIDAAGLARVAIRERAQKAG